MRLFANRQGYVALMRIQDYFWMHHILYISLNMD